MTSLSIHQLFNSTDADDQVDKIELLNEMLSNGCNWNDLDENGDTPGCIALRKGQKVFYEEIVRAGIRTELLFGTLKSKKDGTESKRFLDSELCINDESIRDDENNAVMMEWERDLMKETCNVLLPSKGLKVLNIGFGMGIIDSLFQGRSPSSHVIVEAHPAIYRKMISEGWDKKPGVVVLFGRWQDHIAVLESLEFDAIFYDPFGEYYEDLLEFLDIVVNSLTENGVFSFFNGLAADRQVCYDVCCAVFEIDAADFALAVKWSNISIDNTINWEGFKRPYWTLDNYRLPIVSRRRIG